MTACRNPLHCLVPPRIWEHQILHGTERQRERALRSLRIDGTVRTSRLQNAMLRPRGGFAIYNALAELGRSVVAAPNRTIVDARNHQTVLGPVVRSEGQGSVDDEAVNDAYDGLGDTFDFYLSVYGRNSIDDAGLPLRGVVHYGRDYANAFWDGHQMVFGDGDGEVLGPTTKCLDVVGHELTHGVTEDEAGLIYFGQSGALNESISDVFGSLVLQYTNGQSSEDASWLIGEGCWTPGIDGDALRSMKAPGTAYDDPVVGKDDQPAHMDDYVFTTSDNGGVHTNSGIPNHAFYLVATTIGGNAWERAGKVWYEALRDSRMRPFTNFAAFAGVTASVAERLYGADSTEAQAVRGGWEDVGISVP